MCVADIQLVKIVEKMNYNYSNFLLQRQTKAFLVAIQKSSETNKCRAEDNRIVQIKRLVKGEKTGNRMENFFVMRYALQELAGRGCLITMYAPIVMIMILMLK